MNHACASVAGQEGSGWQSHGVLLGDIQSHALTSVPRSLQRSIRAAERHELGLRYEFGQGVGGRTGELEAEFQGELLFRASALRPAGQTLGAMPMHGR